MTLNPKFVDLERIAIQRCGKQSEQRLYEDYADLFWAQILFVE